jgi:hypothetical protein
MNTKIHIITPLYYGGEHRLEYFQQCITSLKSLINLDKFYFIFLVEPNSEKMVELIPNYFNKIILNNPFRYGMVLNHYIGFKYCFDVLSADFAILIEDDIVVSQDIYNLVQYCLCNNILNDNVLCLLNKHKQFNHENLLYQKETPDVLIQINNVKYLSTWGFGITKNYWNNKLHNMWKMDISVDSNLDLNMKDCGVVSPLISRTNNIGKIGHNYTEELWNLHNFKNINTASLYSDNIYNLININ